MKLVPLFDKVVLEKEKMEETTKSGIVLPGQDDKEKPGQAVVIAVGPGGVVDGKDIKMQVKVLKNFGIVLFGALFGRGLFLIAQEG